MYTRFAYVGLTILLLILSIFTRPSSAFAAASTISFNDLTPTDRVLSGAYPTGIANWGTNSWYLSGPWGSFTSNSVSFNGSAQTSGTVTFTNPIYLTSLDVYNGGTGVTSVTVSCGSNTTITQNVSAAQMLTISTNWTQSCTTLTIGSSNGWWTNFDNILYDTVLTTPTPTPVPTPTPIPTPTPSGTPLPTATPIPTISPSPTPGTGPMLVFHNVVTDANGKILPWNSSNVGSAYDDIISRVWNYWILLPNESNGVPKYLQHRMVENQGTLGGDQLGMALSSWQLLYQYSGNQAVKDNMVKIADFVLSYGLSSTSSAWPNLPFPANTQALPPIGPGFYNGDVVRGVGVTQPDKAGSFGAELVTLYKMTGDSRYLSAAVNIANTLASKTATGSSTVSPLPFRVNVTSDQVVDAYTTNWTPTLRLFDGLISMNQGNVSQYQQAHTRISNWLKTYPLVSKGWGPFFEDVDYYSDTQINAETLALYILEHPSWDPNGLADARMILNSTATQFGDPNWGGVNWANYGVLPIDEQTAYMNPGNSHTARHGSTELLYAEASGDTSRTADAIRALNWATYSVNVDGQNKYPKDNTWLTDGYGDYVRHYLRAMAAAPELAPSTSSHLLRSSSVIKSVQYGASSVSYTTYDTDSTERLKIAFTPATVTVDGDVLDPQTSVATEGYMYDANTAVLQIHHTHGNVVTVAAPVPAPTPTPVPTPTPAPTPVPTPATGVHLAVMSDSSSDEYRADDNRAGSTQYASTTLAWTELLAGKRSVDLGVWGTRSEPRRSGYEFNWARSGAQAADVRSAGQDTGIASQISNGKINIVYFQIGNNDFAYYRDGAAIYNGTIAGTALTTKLDAYVADVTAALDTVLNANPSIKVIMGNVADPGQIPYWQSQFPDPAKRQLVTDALASVNTRIASVAAARSRVSLFDQQEFAQSVLSRVNASGNLVIGGESISMTQNGDEPHHGTIGDNIHGGTVVEGLFANEVIKRMNAALGTTVAEFSDAELIANAGIVAATPTPTPVPTPTPLPTPTPTPVPTPTPTPTPIPGTVVTFNDLTNPNRALNNQYPTNVINWGTNNWYLSGPWGSFTTNSVSFTTNVTSKTFTFITAKKLVALTAYNGGTGSSTITLSCTGNTTKTQTIAAGQKLTISTGWTTACTTVTIGSSNGWWTNFDDITYQ